MTLAQAFLISVFPVNIPDLDAKLVEVSRDRLGGSCSEMQIHAQRLDCRIDLPSQMAEAVLRGELVVTLGLESEQLLVQKAEPAG